MRKTIIAIIGSTRANSSNMKLIQKIQELTTEKLTIEIFEGLNDIPHFNPDLDTENPPVNVSDFREHIRHADGILICTPEYIFSIPGSLKNMLEWCVSTSVFSQKPVGLITASASGEKGHEQLQLIMKTLDAHFTEEATLLISGIKGKFNSAGDLTDIESNYRLNRFIKGFQNLFPV